jgi:type II secretory ATPase GspE/PulE/Tfp pilus assembly ATPase PilB-like protein
MIGEIRDYETVDIAIKSALTGHLVLSTLHTTTSSGAIVRLVNMGVEPYLINSSLICVIAQRLLRKICTYCKEEYPIEKEVIERLNINLKAANLKRIQFFKGKGCPYCFNLGYSGRIGICEALVLTVDIRDLILKNGQEHLIKQQARKEGMRTLREEGLDAALKGLTSLEEVLRVTAPDE